MDIYLQIINTVYCFDDLQINIAEMQRNWLAKKHFIEAGDLKMEL